MAALTDVDFINMTETEYWVLKEQINAGVCKMDCSGFAEFYKTSVETPGGDIYIIEDWDGDLLSVEKVKND